METIFLVLGMEGSPLSLNNHEVLRDEPEGAWAARQLEIIREGGRTVLDRLAVMDPFMGERARGQHLLAVFSSAETQPKGVATAGPVHAKAPSTRQVVGPVIANDRTPSSSAAGEHRSCVQGTEWGYPGNRQFSTYRQCMVSASGTDTYCGINP